MRAILAVLLVALCAQPVLAQGLPGSTAETRAQAQELLTVTGVEAMMTKMLTNMRGQTIQLIQKGNPAASPAAIVKTVDEVMMPEMTRRVPELKEMIGEIWAANYSIDDMKALAEFYASPLGKRVLELQPVIGQQSFAAGMTWGQQVAKDAFAKKSEELARQGLKL